MNYQELKNLYNKKSVHCGNIGKIVLEGDNQIIDLKCNKWHCKECRPQKKFELYLDILRYVYIYDLQKHFIITSEGKKYRKDKIYEESYKFMSKQWIKYLKVIQTRVGKIIYILLARAQKDGYCHYHIITNKYIDWSFLNKKRKKYGLGFVSIQKNKDVAEYLNTDYFKENEWIIPLNVKHFRSSMEIKINNKEKQLKKYFKPQIKDKEIVKIMSKNYGIEIDLEEYYINKYIKNNDLGVIKLKEIKNIEEIIW
ncbi:MAG TPA: hypothetical protein VGB37_16400 [Candidatus Lokiarchaeia archaeon]